MGEARRMAFVALVSANATLVFSSRSSQAGIRRAFAGVSRLAAGLLGATLAGLLLVTGVPAVAAEFGFLPPGLGGCIVAFGTGVATFVLFEAAKLALSEAGAKNGL